MLSGEGNENCEKQKIGLIAAHFLYISLPLFCIPLQRETSRNFLVFTFYGGNVVHVLVPNVSTAAHFLSS